MPGKTVNANPNQLAYPPEYIWRTMTKKERAVVVKGVVATFSVVPRVTEMVMELLENASDP